MVSKKRGRPPGRPKTNEHTQPTNVQILNVATKLFMESGFQKVSIDEVAHEAGMTKATVYYYYGSKSELFKEALVALMERVRERIDGLLRMDQPLYNRLLEITKAHLKATTSLDLESFMRESKASLSDEQVEAMKRAEEQMFEVIEQGFREAIEQGEFPAINARLASHAYLALLKVGNYKDAEGQTLFEDYEEAARQLLDLLWMGLFGEIKKQGE